MAKSKEKLEALRMRRNGESIKVIAKKLSVSVGSVSGWVRDVVLTSRQVKALQKRSTDALYGGKKKYFDEMRRVHQKKIEGLASKGAFRLGKLTNRDVYILGLALYWGEGFKKDSLVGLATSDPIAARFFIRWLKICFHVEGERLIVRVSVNSDYMKRISLIKKYWSTVLEIKESQFSKPFYQKAKWKKEYENKQDYHGIIRIRVRRSIDILREIKGAIEAIR